MGRWLPAVVVGVAVVVVFGRLVGAGYVTWDDGGTVAGNPRMGELSWGNVGYYWGHAAGDLYVPVTYTFWEVVAAVGRGMGVGVSPAVFHGANVIVHLGAGVVVYRVLLMLVGRPWAAGVGALVFAVHPIQVEAVGWVSGGKDVLSGFLALVAVWWYLEFARRGGRGRWGWYVGALGMYGLAVLAKPSAVVVPGVIFVIAVWMEGRAWRGVVRELWVWGVVAVIGAVVAVVVQAGVGVGGVPWWGRGVVAGDAVVFYLGKVVWPRALGIDYGRTPRWVVGSGVGWWTCGVAVVVGVGVWWVGRRGVRWVVGGVLVFVVWLLPVLGFVGFDFQRYSTVADHYVYGAMLGVAIVVAFVMARVRAVGWAYGVAVVVVVVMGVRSFLQVGVWRDSRALYGNAVRVNPGSLAGNLGLGQMARGEGRVGEAVERFKAAVGGHPPDAVANLELASALIEAGRGREAVRPFRVAVEGGKGFPFMCEELVGELVREGDIKEAVEVGEEGVGRWPGDEGLREMVGRVGGMRKDQ